VTEDGPLIKAWKDYLLTEAARKRFLDMEYLDATYAANRSALDVVSSGVDKPTSSLYTVGTPSGPSPEVDALLRREAGLISLETALELEGLTSPRKEPLLPRAKSPAKQPGNATIRDDGLRSYPWQGRQLISATSLRQACGVPYALARWMQGQVALAAVASPTAVKLYADGIYAASTKGDTVAIAELEREAKAFLLKEANSKRDKAADRGTAIHEVVSRPEGTDVSDVPPAIWAAASQFHRAIKELGLTILLQERQVYNLSLGYAGSFDLICIKDGVVTLVDIKTGAGVYIDHAIQLALYRYGEFIGANDVIDNEATDILHSVSALAILHLGDEAYEWIDVPLSKRLGEAVVAQAVLANFYVEFPQIADLPQTGAA
jgi:hypothetical protein